MPQSVIVFPKILLIHKCNYPVNQSILIKIAYYSLQVLIYKSFSEVMNQKYLRY